MKARFAVFQGRFPSGALSDENNDNGGRRVAGHGDPVAQGRREVTLNQVLIAVRKLLLVVSVAVSLVGIRCQAAEIQSNMIKGVNIITVIGEIVADDDARFKTVANTVQGKAIVVLDSPGGKLANGLIIGEAIRARGYATAIPQNATCASVCGLIWLAGAERFISRSGRVGFHRASSNGAESGVGDAIIGAYLTKLGLSYNAVIYVTSAPPNGIQWLNPNEAMRLGISVATLEIVQQPVTTPATLSPCVPAVPTAAEQPQTAAYTEGRRDRVEYERWFQSLPRGSYQNGATFWATNRNVTPPPSCTPPASNGDWQSGCIIARAKLGQIDWRRATDKDYSLGWGSLCVGGVGF